VSNESFVYICHRELGRRGYARKREIIERRAAKVALRKRGGISA